MTTKETPHQIVSDLVQTKRIGKR